MSDVIDLSETLITLTADIVSAHVSHNNVAVGEVSGLIRQVHAALAQLGEPVAPPPPEKQEPAVSVRSSIKPDHIVCLEDGKKLKMLKRYLRTNYNMTPDEYRTKWKLPRDYPMVAPAYAEQRRGLARAIGLGRKKDDAPSAETAAPAAAKAPKAAKTPGAAPKPRGRPAKVKQDAPVEA